MLYNPLCHRGFKVSCTLYLEGCGFTGFQVFTGLRCSRFEKPVRSKKTEKPVFTGDIATYTMPPELEASSMAESQEKFVAYPKEKAPIREFFRFCCKDGQVDSTKAYCTECKVSVKLGGGTSNMSAHVRRHHPLLLNKPFCKAKVKSVRNPPCPAPIDSTGVDLSASTDSDVDPLTNLRLLTLHLNTHKKPTNDAWRSTQEERDLPTKFEQSIRYQ